MVGVAPDDGLTGGDAHHPIALMKRETVTLVGRAHGLAFIDGNSTWKVTINRGQRGLFDFNCVADSKQSIEAFEVMDEGQLIGVIAEVPPSWSVTNLQLLVQRLEILGKPLAAVEG